MVYGDKRSYRKIDIYVAGKYECSTTWARTCKEAVEKYLERGIYYKYADKVTASFEK